MENNAESCQARALSIPLSGSSSSSLSHGPSHGFVPGDLIQVLKSSLIESDILTRQNIEDSLREIKPISLKDIIIDIPKVFWSDIGGNKDLINKIRQSIEWPLKHPEAFKRIGILPPNVYIINLGYFAIWTTRMQ